MVDDSIKTAVVPTSRKVAMAQRIVPTGVAALKSRIAVPSITAEMLKIPVKQKIAGLQASQSSASRSEWLLGLTVEARNQKKQGKHPFGIVSMSVKEETIFTRKFFQR